MVCLYGTSDHIDKFIKSNTEEFCARVLSRTTKEIYLFHTSLEPIEEMDASLRTFFRLANLTKINLPPFRDIRTLTIHFEYNAIFLNEIATLVGNLSLIKFSLFSASNMPRPTVELPSKEEIPPTVISEYTKFFSHIFMILEPTIESLHIKKLFVGDLEVFLAGIAKLIHLKKLKLPYLDNYDDRDAALFHRLFAPILSNSSTKLQLVSIPFGVGPALLNTLASTKVYALRMSPVGMIKLPDTLRMLTLRDPFPPAIFKSFLQLNLHSQLTRLVLLDHDHYATAENLDDLVYYIANNKRLMYLYLGEFHGVTDPEPILEAVIKNTTLQSLNFGLHPMVQDPIAEGEEEVDDQLKIAESTAKEIVLIQTIFKYVIRNISIENIGFDISDRELLESTAPVIDY
eukprot:gene10779-12558_t